jgi:5-formyltetrahydrofolate cyclo-ligase
VPDDTPPHETDAKSAWRAWARARRRSLASDDAAREEADARSLEHLLAWAPWREARWALVYLAFGDEANPLGAGPRATTPRLAATRTAPGVPLTVHALDRSAFDRSAFDRGAFERHPFGFLQPTADATPVPLDEVDVILVPGLVFDVSGVRLGYGRGLYDRLLAPLRPTVATVGVTREALVVPRLPREAHDVPVRYLLSEAGLRPAAHD